MGGEIGPPLEGDHPLGSPSEVTPRRGAVNLPDRRPAVQARREGQLLADPAAKALLQAVVMGPLGLSRLGHSLLLYGAWVLASKFTASLGDAQDIRSLTVQNDCEKLWPDGRVRLAA